MSDLTKWPRLLVVGQPVTREQANEILIRTCIPDYLSGNDRVWDAQVEAIMGMPVRDDWHLIPDLRDNAPKRLEWLKGRWALRDARTAELGIFGGEYLHTSRISSSDLFGPHGWCDWDGRIFCDSYNIGKWPSTEDLTTEWTHIAEAFPYLDLTAQVITDEGDGELAGEWRVKDGTVTFRPDPEERIALYPGEANAEAELRTALIDVLSGREGRERGVSAERLAEAVEQVETAMRGREAQG